MANKTLTLITKLPGSNQIIQAAKTSPQAYSRMKKEYTTLVVRELIRQKCVPGKPYDKIKVNYQFYEKRLEARDPDNIMGGIKFCMDAMVTVGIIEDDDIYNVSIGEIKFIPDNKDYKVKISWEII